MTQQPKANQSRNRRGDIVIVALCALVGGVLGGLLASFVSGLTNPVSAIAGAVIGAIVGFVLARRTPAPVAPAAPVSSPTEIKPVAAPQQFDRPQPRSAQRGTGTTVADADRGQVIGGHTTRPDHDQDATEIHID